MYYLQQARYYFIIAERYFPIHARTLAAPFPWHLHLQHICWSRHEWALWLVTGVVWLYAPHPINHPTSRYRRPRLPFTTQLCSKALSLPGGSHTDEPRSLSVGRSTANVFLFPLTPPRADAMCETRQLGWRCLPSVAACSWHPFALTFKGGGPY